MQNLILQQGHTCKIGINIYTTSNSMDNIFCIGVFLNESTSYDITDRFDGISWQNALKMYSELLKKKSWNWIFWKKKNNNHEIELIIPGKGIKNVVL